MLCVILTNYDQPCQNTVGGVNRGWVFDPADFNFTEGAPNADGSPSGYSAIALRGGTGASFGTVTFTPSGPVLTAPVAAGGTNYPYTTIALTFTGGGGTGAAGYATVVGGVIVSTTITAGGTGYTTAPSVALSVTGPTVAAGGRLFSFGFYENTGEYTYENPDTETCSTKYSHSMVGQFLNISQGLNNYLLSLGTAGCCCGLGMIIELNSGVILVMGEKYVGNVEQKRFKLKLSSKGGSGKKFEDFNGAEVTVKGDFIRPLYTFTGGVAALLAFQ